MFSGGIKLKQAISNDTTETGNKYIDEGTSENYPVILILTPHTDTWMI